MSYHDLPTLNASLNSTSALLLIAGFIFIKRRQITAHKTCMISASFVSLLFLISYTIYHVQAKVTPFEGEGFTRIIYFSILIPHTILATVAVLPLAVITLTLALRGKLVKHRKVARWTLPIWLFVSVTGVTIYWMLYQM